jgi:DNA-binding NtrC family response regulator
MAKEELEEVLKKRVKPILDTAMEKFIGAKVVDIETDIADRLMSGPLFEFEINIALGFKKAKKLFKRTYLVTLLEMHLGNVSKVAEVAGIDRRSIHRMLIEMKIKPEKFRGAISRSAYMKEEAVKDIIEDTLDNYKRVINPDRLEKMYKHVTDISKDIVKELPSAPLTMKEAEREFEKQFILKALKQSKFNITKTAKKIGLRFETLHRKMKVLGI